MSARLYLMDALIEDAKGYTTNAAAHNREYISL